VPFWRTPVFRWSVFVVGLGMVALVLVVGAEYSSGSLDWPLLLLLLDAVVVGVLCGPLYGVVVAIISAIGVLYFIAYPANTWSISNINDVVSLIVFVAVGVAAVVLVTLITRARDGEARATARARLLATVVDAETTPTVSSALERIRKEFNLERVVLLGPMSVGSRDEIASTGEHVGTSHRSIEVELPDDHELVGYGPPLFAEDKQFLDGLASAAYRAYDTQRFSEEQKRSQLLAEADSARAAVLAAVGHDLRTPLSGLRVALEGMHPSGHALSEEEYAELLDTAERSTRRLDELISNLIDLSRLQAGVLPVTIEPTDIDAVVAQSRLDVSRGDINVVISDELPLVDTDAVLLERIVVNLLSNAVRHSPEGSRVDISTAVVGSDAVISVADHGPGLTEAQRELLLVGSLPGKRRADGGSGLGLAIVRQLTAALGGRLSVAETRGGGLTVNLALPISGAGDRS
jgi:K+-sensing histidine kinase KdpD